MSNLSTVVLPLTSTAEFNRGSTAAAPSAPANFAAAAGSTQVDLTWSGISDILRYHIYYSTSSPVTNSDTRIQVNASSTSYTVSGLTNGVTYYFKLAAVGPGGESALTDESSAVPSAYANDFSLQFDGSTEYATWTSDDNVAVTISFWIKIDAAIAGFPRFIQTPGYLCVYDPSVQNLQFRANWSTLGIWASPSSSLPKNGVWRHVIVSYDGASASNQAVMYIDGANQSVAASPSPTGTRVSAAGASAIGASTTPDNYHKGNLDEISIWSTNLDAAAVAAVYNSGSPPDLSALASSASLVHWWRMGDTGTIPTIPDVIGSADLTTVNMTSGNIVADVP